MPHGVLSTEARVERDSENPTFDQELALELLDELEAVVGHFDWHSQVTIRFSTGDGGAAWSRSQRTITVHEGYLRRFVEQGKVAAARTAGEPTGQRGN